MVKKEKQSWKEIDEIQDVSTHARNFFDEFAKVEMDENSTEEHRKIAKDEMIKRIEAATEKMDDYLENHKEDAPIV